MAARSRPVLGYRPPEAAPAPAPRAWERRGTVAMVCAALCLVVALGYARSAWPMAMYRLLTDGLLALLWLLAAYGIGSLMPLPDRSPESAALRVVTHLATGLGVISLLTLGLGLAGAMNRALALAMILAGLAVAVAQLVRARAALAADARRWWGERAGWGWLWALAMPFLGMSLVAALVPPGVLWGDEPNGYDVVEYHLQVPREWYEGGRITPLGHNAFSYFPFNVEMHYLLAMHLRAGPWAGMYLAQLMHVGFVASSVAAVYAVARAAGAGAGASGTLAGVAASVTPWLALLAPVAYNEGGLLLYGTLAIGWTMRAPRDASRAVASMALAGAMAGLACGVKLTAVAMLLAPLPCAFLAIAAARRTPLPRALVASIAFALVGLALYSPWLVRNVIWAANPVFPEAQRVLGPAHFSEAQTQRWEAAHAPRPEQRGLTGRLAAGWEQLIADARYGYALLPLALVAGAVTYRRAETWLLLAMLGVFAVVWLGFTHLQGRFFVLAIPVAALLVGQVRGRAKVVVAAVLLVAAGVGFAGVHQRLTTWLHAKRLVVALGVESLSAFMVPQVAGSVPQDLTLILVGDAKAFCYQRPMSRLRYRTVFDVRSGDDWLAAWTGTPPDGRAVTLVDPGELSRFARTYRGLPPVPDDVLQRREPFLLETPSR